MIKDQLLLLAVLLLGLGLTAAGAIQAMVRPRRGLWILVAACGGIATVLVLALLIT